MSLQALYNANWWFLQHVPTFKANFYDMQHDINLKLIFFERCSQWRFIQLSRCMTCFLHVNPADCLSCYLEGSFYHRIEAPLPTFKVSYHPNSGGSLLELLFSLSLFISQSFSGQQISVDWRKYKGGGEQILESKPKLTWRKKYQLESLPDQHSLDFLDKVIQQTDNRP